MSVRLSCFDLTRRAIVAATALSISLVPMMASAQPGGVTGRTAATVPALSGAARWADSARRLIDRGVIASDTLAIAAGERVARKALTAFPNDAMLLHYAGYATYRLAQRMEGDAARDRFESAVTTLEASAAVRPLAETFALIASAKGSMIGDSMLRGMRLGPQATAAEDRARELSAGNPRLLLLTGVSAMFKPSAFGGGDDRAYERLTKAIKAFEAERVPPPMPAWGHAEAWAWLGQLELKRGRQDAARAAYDRALALEPGYAWVVYALKPALEKSAGRVKS
jgi:tetratricopeptide (TPR) repeat protein